MKNMPNLSQEIEKNTENVTPYPLPTKNIKIVPSKGKYNHKVSSLTIIRVLSRIICANFHKKPNSSQEIEKNITRQTKKVP